MITRFEAVGIFACIALMTLAIFLLRVDSTTSALSRLEGETQSAVVVVGDGEDTDRERALAVADSLSSDGQLNRLVIDDINFGSGPEATAGDTVRVHYIGRLTNGQEFDNSYKRGEPITFTLGSGEVIRGWEEGIAGMQVGSERVLVVPPEFGYGTQAVGPIPANSVLIFAVELVEIL